MQPANFEEALEAILTKDSRYHRDSYHFVREALDFTQKLVVKSRTEGIRHVSGQQLLDGVRQFALEQFGPMTFYLLQEWGVRQCEDFGEIVFNLVEFGVLKKTDNDSREDFQNGYNFEVAFLQPFIPSGKKAVASPQPSSTPSS